MKSGLRIGIAACGLREYIEGLVSEFSRQVKSHQVYIYYNIKRFLGRYPEAIEQFILAVSSSLTMYRINL